MLQHAGLDNSFWAEPVNTAVYVRNRCLGRSTWDKTPFQLLFGKAPDISNFKAFGWDRFVKNPDKLRQKLDPKSESSIFLGYFEN